MSRGGAATCGRSSLHPRERSLRRRRQRSRDHADDRVQWGKGAGPYCRFALDNSYEGNPDIPFTAPPRKPSTSSPSPSKRLQSQASSTLTPLKPLRSKRPTSNTLSPQLRPRRIDFNINTPSPSTPLTSSSIFIRGGNRVHTLAPQSRPNTEDI